MILEKENSLKSFDSYMPYAKYTSGVPIVLFSLLSKNYQIDLEVLALEGEIIRLLNDIKTYSKEHKCGKINAIDLFQDKNTIYKIIEYKIQTLKSAFTRIDDSLFEFLLRLIFIIEDFYKIYDFHEFSLDITQSYKFHDF